jgi:amidohydrolase
MLGLVDGYPELVMSLEAAITDLTDELIELRRDIHAHPELSWQEERTTALVADRLAIAGVPVRLLSKGGLVAELGTAGPVIALRADLDALPVDDRTNDPWASKVDGVAHACGHDVHTIALVGAGLALAQQELPGRVRLLFQSAEEVMPGGALEMIAEGVLDQVTHVFGLHCDPSLDVGYIGLREGPLTGASDSLTIRLSGKGGHTSRPHLTQDLTFALGSLVTQLPATLSRRLDPRAGASVVWGMVRSGSATNVIPASGELAGTVRMLDSVAWADAEGLVRELIDQIVAPYGVLADTTYLRGVPPVVNEPGATRVLARAARSVVGADNVVPTAQSLGGEDFAWFVDTVPGAMARLGTRTPGGPTYDLHQGDLRVDERAVVIGARLLAGVAERALQVPSARNG